MAGVCVLFQGQTLERLGMLDGARGHAIRLLFSIAIGEYCVDPSLNYGRLDLHIYLFAVWEIANIVDATVTGLYFGSPCGFLGNVVEKVKCGLLSDQGVNADKLIACICDVRYPFGFGRAGIFCHEDTTSWHNKTGTAQAWAVTKTYAAVLKLYVGHIGTSNTFGGTVHNGR